MNYTKLILSLLATSGNNTAICNGTNELDDDCKRTKESGGGKLAVENDVIIFKMNVFIMVLYLMI